MKRKKTLCEQCRNAECEYAGRKVWVMICAHEYVAPPKTIGDEIRDKNDEELAEFLAARETALVDFILRQLRKTLKEKRGIEIDFGKHFYPDLFTLKAEYLERLKTKVDGGEV